jgi:hypothetical protein
MTIDTWKSIGRGALVAAAGAALAALTSATAGIDFGPFAGPFVSAALAVVTNVLRKYVTEPR